MNARLLKRWRRSRPGGVLLALALIFCHSANAQRIPNWRVYRLADGLAELSCLSVTISPQGKVLARHPGTGLISQLDGYTISLLPAPETAKGRVYESPGGQLWMVTPDGLQEMTSGSWQLHPLPELAAEFGEGPGRALDPVPLYPIRQGYVVMLLSQRLVEISLENPERPHLKVLRAASNSQLGRFLGLAAARDGGLWLSGTRGLAKLLTPARNIKPDSPWTEHLVPEGLPVQNLSAPQEDNAGRVLAIAECATNQQKVVVQFDGAQWQITAPGIERLRRAWRGPDGRIWGMATAGLYEWRDNRPEVTECEEIAARHYFDVALEPGGAFWLATSDGLFRYAALAWQSPEWMPRISSPVRCLTGDREGTVWFLAGASLHQIRDQQHREYPLPAGVGRLAANIRALFPLRSTGLLLEADGRLFRFDPGANALRAVSTEGKVRMLGLLPDGTVCGQEIGSQSLFKYDGDGMQPFVELPTTNSLGTNLQAFLSARNGDLWVAGELGVGCYHDKKWSVFTSFEGRAAEPALFLVEVADGKIWCATEERIWQFDGRDWTIVRRGFDRINALLRGRDGSVWAASNTGLHRYVQDCWVENGTEDGLPGLVVRGLWEDQRAGLWAGTSRGLSLYHPEADPDPPRTTIHKVGANDNNVPEGDAVYVTFNGQDKWKYTDRDRLLFSTRWDKTDWSPFQELTRVELSELAAGRHYVQVRAMDRNGNVEFKPAQLEFLVVAPWYRETRLVLIGTAGLLAAFFFAALAFNRHRQLVSSYAEVEKKVAERTEQLDQANRELLHSQKMTALGTLAAGIAHDFNNIFSIIKGSTQIIEDNLDNPDKIRTRADRIKMVVEQGAGIVRAMLGFSRDSDQQAVPCEVNPIVHDTLKLLGDRFLRETQITFSEGEGLPEVMACREFVQQILLNFIFNASEAESLKKEIDIRASKIQRPPPGVVLAARPAPGYIAVTVRDFGTGIAPEIMPRIFEPFFTTKARSARRGTGLGLSMAYELAKKMGAGLAAESTVGQGSTFTVVLPERDRAVKTQPGPPS